MLDLIYFVYGIIDFFFSLSLRVYVCGSFYREETTIATNMAS